MEQNEKSQEIEIEIEITLLPSGDVRFSRFDPATNESIIEIISELASPEKMVEVRRFLEGANSIEHIFGDEPLCG